MAGQMCMSRWDNVHGSWPSGLQMLLITKWCAVHYVQIHGLPRAGKLEVHLNQVTRFELRRRVRVRRTQDLEGKRGRRGFGGKIRRGWRVFGDEADIFGALATHARAGPTREGSR